MGSPREGPALERVTGSKEMNGTETLESLFLGNALQCAEHCGAEMGVYRRNWIIPAIGGALFVVGLAGIIWCPVGVCQRLSDALFILGFLTLAVDPLLRRRLLKEATTDIFHHLLGFDLPVEIREALKDFLLQNRYYRENVIIDVHAETASDGMVDITWTMRADVVAVAATEYRQHTSFEEAEQGRVLQASVTSTSRPQLNYEVTTPSLTPDKNEPMVSAWFGKKMKLKKGDELQTFLKFVTRGHRTGFSTNNFASSTINPRIRVTSSDDLEIYASQSDQRIGNEYIYRKVFVPSDHIQVRWKPKSRQ